MCQLREVGILVPSSLEVDIIAYCSDYCLAEGYTVFSLINMDTCVCSLVCDMKISEENMDDEIIRGFDYPVQAVFSASIYTIETFVLTSEGACLETEISYAAESEVHCSVLCKGSKYFTYSISGECVCSSVCTYVCRGSESIETTQEDTVKSGICENHKVSFAVQSVDECNDNCKGSLYFFVPMVVVIATITTWMRYTYWIINMYPFRIILQMR